MGFSFLSVTGMKFFNIKLTEDDYLRFSHFLPSWVILQLGVSIITIITLTIQHSEAFVWFLIRCGTKSS